MLWVYILVCADGSLYTGMTVNLRRRWNEHRKKTARCKFTRRSDKHPLTMGVCWTLDGVKGDALRLERYIKELPRTEKLALVEDGTRLKEFVLRDEAEIGCTFELHEFKEEILEVTND